MIKNYIKKLTEKSKKTYLACVRRTATQFQTIDVEIISDEFDIDTPNENYFIYGVQLAPVVLVYADNNTIDRPKINSYVVITQTDNGTWWVIVYGEKENYTVSANDIIIDFGVQTVINNSDVISIKKEFEMGVYRSDVDEVTIKGSSIKLQIKNTLLYNYIELTNKIEVNSLNKGVFISQMEYVDTQNINYHENLLSQLYQIYFQNLFITPLSNLDNNIGYFIIIYYIYKSQFTSVNEPTSPYNDPEIEAFITYPTLFDDMYNFFKELFNYQGNLFSYLYSLHGNSSYVFYKTKFFSNNYQSYINYFSNILNSQHSKIQEFKQKLNVINTSIKTYIYNYNILYCASLLRETIIQVLNNIYDNTPITREFNTLIESTIYNEPDYIETIDTLFNKFKDKSVRGNSDLLEYIKSKIAFIKIIINDKKVNANTNDNNLILNLGNIFDDIINSLQNYSVLVTNTSIPSTAPGYIVSGYYSDTKLLSNNLLPTL